MSSPTAFSIYDDTSSNFLYGANWVHITDKSGYAWDNTLSYTSSVSNVTINFSGSYMQLYGVVGQTSEFGSPTIRVWLDNGYQGAATFPEYNTSTYDVLFVNPDHLSDGNHQLVLENSQSGMTLFLDYFQGPLPSSTVSNMPAIVTKTVTPTDPALMSGSNLSSGSPSTPVAAIVGGVVGGITLLASITIAVFFYMRRNRRNSPYFYKSVDAADLLEPETREPKMPPPSTVTPFPPSQVARSEIYNDRDDRSSLPTTVNNYPEQRSQPDVGHIYPPSVGRSSSLVSSSAGQSSISSRPLLSGKAALAAQDARSSYGLQHRDSGMRFGEAGPSNLPPTEEVDVPPEYSES